jgi:hypothetical protein
MQALDQRGGLASENNGGSYGPDQTAKGSSRLLGFL